MIKQTTDYSMFKFREDNREKGVDPKHVMKIYLSIKEKNLLPQNPILLNGKMEIIDGQHRVKAAEMLGLPVYYEVKEDLNAEDIIRLNINRKNWTTEDYVNFWCKHGKPEYLKFKEFAKNNSMTMNALMILTGKKDAYSYNKLRKGELLFDEQSLNPYIDNIKRSIDLIEKIEGKKNHLRTGRAWKAFMWLFKQPEFNETKWFIKLERFSDRIKPKSSEIGYKRLFVKIHNWKSSEKVILDEQDAWGDE